MFTSSSRKCFLYETPNRCKYGSKCRYLHDQEKLRELKLKSCPNEGCWHYCAETSHQCRRCHQTMESNKMAQLIKEGKCPYYFRPLECPNGSVCTLLHNENKIAQMGFRACPNEACSSYCRQESAQCRECHFKMRLRQQAHQAEQLLNLY